MVSALLALTPEPTDVVAVATFRQGQEVRTGSARWQAEEAYREVIDRRPLDPQPWRELGDLYAASGRFDNALHAYSQARRRGDGAATLDRSLAQLHSNLGDSRRAARHWLTYLARRPHDRAARLALARAAIQGADWEHARTELERLLSDDPANPMIHTWLGLLLIGPEPEVGMSHLRQAAKDAAIAEFLTPVFAAERMSSAIYDPAYRSALLGVSMLNLDITTLAQISEGDSVGSDGAAKIDFRKVVTTLALRSLLTATDSSRGYADAYAYLGQAFDELGWANWAKVALQYALQLTPQSPVVQTLMGLYWDRHGASTLARHYYERAYSQDRNNVALCLEIAATYVTEGEYTAAEAWLLSAVDIAPNDPQVWKTIAHFYLDLGIDVKDSGFMAATKLLELAPNDAQAHDLMGWAYYLTEQDTLAGTSLHQALALNPMLASAHYHLGRLYARQGRHAEASEHLHRAADYDVEGRLAAQLERAWDDLPADWRERPLN
jgi:tetratricopeptide (TPR) repeat protein